VRERGCILDCIRTSTNTHTHTYPPIDSILASGRLSILIQTLSPA
jgi:hypothetical protein